MEAAELDAKVLAAMGWDVWQTEFGEWRCHAPSAVGSDRNRRWTMLSNVNVSTSDPEAVRLCGPWLDEHCTLWIVYSRKTSFQCDGWVNRTKLDTSELYDTRAEALCRLVLAVAEREAERKEKPNA